MDIEALIRGMVQQQVDDYLFERQLATLGPDGASPRTTTPASREDPSGAVCEFSGFNRVAAATSRGSQASSSPPKIQGLSPLLTVSQRAQLSHAASCSSCQESPEALLSLSRMLAQAAAGLSESTSRSEATSSSVDSEPGPATSGSSRSSDEEWRPIETKGPGQVMNVFNLSEGWETRCVAMVPLTFEFRQALQPKSWPRCDYVHKYDNGDDDRCVSPAGHSGEHEI